MNAPFKINPIRGRALSHAKAVARRFHEQAFGEELARVNLDFTLAERLEYLNWMRDTGRRSGRELPPSHSVAWLLEVEKEVEAEEAKKA